MIRGNSPEGVKSFNDSVIDFKTPSRSGRDNGTAANLRGNTSEQKDNEKGLNDDENEAKFFLFRLLSRLLS